MYYNIYYELYLINYTAVEISKVLTSDVGAIPLVYMDVAIDDLLLTMIQTFGVIRVSYS